MAVKLPDVFLLSVFEKLCAIDRVNASQVCTSWNHRVREVNQNVRFLTIFVSSILPAFKGNLIDEYTYEYSTAVKQQLLKNAQSEAVKNGKDREKFVHSTKHNTLRFSTFNIEEQQLNLTIVQQIITAFSAVTELNFITYYDDISQYDYLLQMLKTGDQKNCKKGWGQQLTTLRVIDVKNYKESVETSKRLFTAINELPALKKLVIELNNYGKKGIQLHDLPVLARLKAVSFYPKIDGELNKVFWALSNGMQLRMQTK